MKHALKVLVALLSVAVAPAVLVGCSLLNPVTEKVADAVDRYCEEPQSERALIRETVNAELASEGHSVVVTCAGDSP